MTVKLDHNINVFSKDSPTIKGDRLEKQYQYDS